MKVKERKYQKGITLIALVITIIVLLILAGVTLSIVFNGGIINKSQTAVDKYTEESAKEKLSLAIFNYKMGKITGEAGEGEGQKTFFQYIEEMGGRATHNEGEKTYTVILDGYEFTVDDSTYEITSNGGTSGGTETPVTPEVKKYTITYNANGGTGSMEAGEKTEGISYIIASNEFTAATGYGFKEWNTQADGKGTKYTENQSYSTEANLTLYAIWDKNVYYIGDTVTIGGEQFYVLADSDSSQAEVTLIAKYNLNKAGTAQAPNAAYGDTGCVFCSDATYKALGSFTAGENLNDNTKIKADTKSAVYKAKAYAKTITGDSTNDTGRLLTKGEAEKLNTLASLNNNVSTMLWGKENTQSDGNYLYYWVGSAIDFNYLCSLGGKEENFFNTMYNSTFYGVRPVLTVSKSSIE